MKIELFRLQKRFLLHKLFIKKKRPNFIGQFIFQIFKKLLLSSF
jgi:hypothetical protein